MTSAIQVYQIPDLPELEARPIDGLGPIPLTQAEWFEWKPQVELHRSAMLPQVTENWTGRESAREQEIRRCRDGRYWLSTYGAIYQARPDEDLFIDDEWNTEDESVSNGWVIPFIPYHFQLYYWDAQHRAFRTKGPKGDVVVVKSRQMGMSNMACAVFLHAWMTKKPFQGRLLSRKEDLVDETNNPDSLFWKIELLMKATPKWLLQAFAPGFDWRRDRMLASISNPSNFNHLAGESTNATAGRGPAATSLLLDEYAFMRGGAGIWTATRAATRHRIAISTVHMKLGTHFYDLVEKTGDDAPVVLRFPWFLHPDHTPEWFDMERKRDTEAGFQTEVMMNFFGDISEFVYPEFGSRKVGDYPYIPYGGDAFITMDDAFSGYWAILVIQYVYATGRHRVVDAYRNNGKITDFYGSLLRATMVDGFEYGEAERQFMDTMRKIQSPVFIGDTHGRHKETNTGQSVIERLAERWGISVNVDYMKRDEKDRQEYLGKLAPFIDWNDNPRVQMALRSCQRYRWKEIEDSSELTSIIKSPIKNHDSHDPTALEYYATNWEFYKTLYIPGGRIKYGASDARQLWIQ